MVKSSRATERAGASVLRRRHRASILALLVSVCGDLERLRVSPAARLACREVAALLRSALTRERGLPESRK